LNEFKTDISLKDLKEKKSDNKTANINVKNYRFNTSVTTTPVKRRKRQEIRLLYFRIRPRLVERLRRNRRTTSK